MTALTDARTELGALLEAAGITVLRSPSVGRFTVPAVLIGPGPEWYRPNAQLGEQLQGQLELTLTLLAGLVSADASLTQLEALVTQVAPLVAGQQWTLTSLRAPYALTLAGTEYLATSTTIRRTLVI
jgi:hypothetical protein